MMVTKKCLSRRTVLRGMGVTLALPLLDSMVPAFAAMRETAAKPVRRFGAIYFPNGVNVKQWAPATEGAGFEFTRILKPLSPFRDRLLVVSGLCNKQADPNPGEGGGDHSRSQASFLTGAHAKKTQVNPELGKSMDQIVAAEFGRYTQLASLELALESNEMVGGCEFGLACAYSGTLSWSSPTTPLPTEDNPRAVFERMFGTSGTDPRARLARLRKDRSILDMVTGELAGLRKQLGPNDRTKLAEYSEAIRDIERRIQLTEAQSGQELPAAERPAGIPPTFAEHAKLMYDLMALAYQCDLTRVSTLLVGREQSGRTFPEIGVPESWHPTSHHGNNPVELEKYAKINTYNVELFAHFLQRLQSTPDGDGTLLDHSIIIYGCGMSNGNGHIHHDVPIVVAGGGAGQIKGGRHLRFTKAANTICDHTTPLANLHLTILDKMGIPVEDLGDATGKLETLSDI